MRRRVDPLSEVHLSLCPFQNRFLVTHMSECHACRSTWGIFAPQFYRMTMLPHLHLNSQCPFSCSFVQEILVGHESHFALNPVESYEEIRDACQGLRGTEV